MDLVGSKILIMSWQKKLLHVNLPLCRTYNICYRKQNNINNWEKIEFDRIPFRSQTYTIEGVIWESKILAILWLCVTSTLTYELIDFRTKFCSNIPPRVRRFQKNGENEQKIQKSCSRNSFSFNCLRSNWNCLYKVIVMFQSAATSNRGRRIVRDCRELS